MASYKRILLKLSGEALMGSNSHGIDPQRLQEYADEIHEASKAGLQIGIVIGGGNIFRGLSGSASGFDRVKGDYMGMLATVINGLALQSAIIKTGTKARVFSAFRIDHVTELFERDKVTESLENNQVAILTAGTGNPFFTTDTAAALRAVEIKADVLLKGTRVDGIYNADPEKYHDAVRYENLTFAQAINQRLNIMDLTAFTLCMENEMPVIVFNMNDKGNLMKLISGEKVGTLVKN
jgi:uridylate kinase